ncbi:hypothetical protein ACFSKN_10440 [Mariniflexile gromovii]|uniref:Uncharacterized protein n=1 Tax=Mariniflexile gromovii TaxID=362523 RepID=A0ABS4BYF1_9FLAO|nr:hypothetical protein [Mariniflexile gromovii]MBP0905615.1 hypothetical protein [Mariniflexile gromovii]
MIYPKFVNVFLLTDRLMLYLVFALAIEAASFLPLKAKRYSGKRDPCGNAQKAF